MASSTQRLLQFFEQGAGAKIIVALAVAAAVVAFSGYYSYKRFNGPLTEHVLEQALVGKSLAEGGGFSTPVVHPQALAYLMEHQGYAVPEEGELNLPELYHAPGYPLVLATFLKLMGEGGRDWVFEPPPVGTSPFTSFHADFFLLGVNLLFLWLAVLLLFLLALRLFSLRVAILASLGLLFSLGIWSQTMSVNGTTVLMFLFLLLLHLWTSIEQARTDDSSDLDSRLYPLTAAAVGLVCGLIYLTEYTAGLVLLVFLAYCGICLRGRALGVCVAVSLTVFCLTASWWTLRNVELTGSPVALAWQSLPLFLGDPTADPEAIRLAFSAEPPEFSIRKILGKGLKGIEENLTQHLWTGGAYFFAGLFLVSLLYAYRDPSANSLRWVSAGILGFLLFLQPFFASGVSGRIPALYLSPLLILFGAAFFFILLQGDGRRTETEKIVIAGILLVLQGAPLLHNLAKPPVPHFHAPVYYPSIFANYLSKGVLDNFKPGYVAMSDIPAGVAWYTGHETWAQPGTYFDFDDMHNEVRPVGALYLSPLLLDRPFFKELAKAELDRGEELDYRPDWATIYANLRSGDLPVFFPLQIRDQVSSNIFLLRNRLAQSKE